MRTCQKARTEDISNVLRKFQRELEQMYIAVLTPAIYGNYLTLQYHLTKGLQKSFFKIALHPQIQRNHRLRGLSLALAQGGDLDHQLAAIDLERMGQVIGPCPLDVSLWWAYQDAILASSPLQRLGSSLIFICLGSSFHSKRMFADAEFLSSGNTRFLSRFQDMFPSKGEILESLETAELNREQMSQLLEGVNSSAIMFLRMLGWATKTYPLYSVFDASSSLKRETQHDELEELLAYLSSGDYL